MDFFREILKTFFSQSRLEQQLELALFSVGFICLYFAAVYFAARRFRKTRLQPRKLLESPVNISWWSSDGPRALNALLGRDFSEGGLSLEQVPEPIKVGTKVSFHLSATNSDGAGIVRHCTQTHAGYVVGIQFTRRTRALANLSSTI